MGRVWVEVLLYEGPVLLVLVGLLLLLHQVVCVFEFLERVQRHELVLKDLVTELKDRSLMLRADLTVDAEGWALQVFVFKHERDEARLRTKLSVVVIADERPFKVEGAVTKKLKWLNNGVTV